MLKNKPLYIFGVILIAMLIIAISVVVSQYNKNKPIVPGKYLEVSSSNDMAKIKETYDSEEKKQQFLQTCEDIELAVANSFLDGSVTNDIELVSRIQKINGVLKSDDWSYLGLQMPDYWMGEWRLDEKGSVTFTFQSENIKPDWAQDEDVKKYIK